MANQSHSKICHPLSTNMQNYKSDYMVTLLYANNYMLKNYMLHSYCTSKCILHGQNKTEMKTIA